MTATRDILEKAVAGQRLTVAEGVRLLEDGDLLELGAAAHAAPIPEWARGVLGRRPPLLGPTRLVNPEKRKTVAITCAALRKLCRLRR